jgi:hypothetical protein
MNIDLDYGFLVRFGDEAVSCGDVYVSSGITDSKFIKNLWLFVIYLISVAVVQGFTLLLDRLIDE